MSIFGWFSKSAIYFEAIAYLLQIKPLIEFIDRLPLPDAIKKLLFEYLVMKHLKKKFHGVF